VNYSIKLRNVGISEYGKKGWNNIVYRDEDNSGQCGLSRLHPIVALDQTVLRSD
jgi:hypothetical protein